MSPTPTRAPDVSRRGRQIRATAPPRTSGSSEPPWTWDTHDARVVTGRKRASLMRSCPGMLTCPHVLSAAPLHRSLLVQLEVQSIHHPPRLMPVGLVFRL
ncbi:hypothetical protein BKA81DRAFT_223625 [Phyllosticta paracitricarpa]